MKTLKVWLCGMALGIGLASVSPRALVAQQPVWGDVNGDGGIGAVDAQAILSAVVGLPLPAGFITENGDANCDGAIGAVDAQIVLSFVVSLNVAQFCVGKPIVHADVDVGTSYLAQLTDIWIGYSVLRGTRPGFMLAVGYGDFNGDGKTDVLTCPGDGSTSPTACELYLNTGSGFQYTTLAGNPGLVHGRKILVADFNGDGKPDAFLIGHGFDQPPYPGEAPILLLSSASGLTPSGDFSSYVGYHHGGAAGDIDGNGTIDIVLTSTTIPSLLLNDGKGNFTNAQSRLPAELSHQSWFTAELRDVDKDGHLDLLVSGHEQDGFASRILWGSSSGAFTWANSTVLPAVPGYGVAIDIDVEDLDGDGIRDVVLNRTGDPSGPGFYRGYYIQLIKNLGGRKFANFNGASIYDPAAGWNKWLRLQDVNGDGKADIIVDDQGWNLRWANDGSGHFTRIP